MAARRFHYLDAGPFRYRHLTGGFSATQKKDPAGSGTWAVIAS